MALLPIMPTPTLEGEDAARFYKMLDENEHKRAPSKEVREGRAIYEAVMRRNSGSRRGQF